MMNNKLFAMKKLQTELEKINNEMDCISAGPIDDDLFKWNIMFEGPQETLYEGGLFQIEMQFPEDYPINPPKMIFKSEMFHPNIYPDGKVCISILHPAEHDQFNEQERMDEKWRPVLGVEEVLVSVISMLNSPNIDSPANVDAAIMFRDDKAAFKTKVKALTRKTMEF